MKMPTGGETNVTQPSRFELTDENVANALDVALRSTPGLQWGPAPYEPGDMEKLMAKSGGPAVYCAWTGPKEDEVYAALTGNGPTSEVNALFYSHARDIVVALIEERERHLDALRRIASGIPGNASPKEVALAALASESSSITEGEP